MDETLLNMETLNYKKHLENYKVKMRLIISKMETDKKEIEQGIEIAPKEVEEDEETIKMQEEQQNED